MNKTFSIIVRGLFAFAIYFTVPAAFAEHRTDRDWIATWATAVSTQSPFDAPTPQFNDVTLRQIVRVSIGGHRLRVWLSNEHGTEPLVVQSASIAHRDAGSAVRAGTVRQLTFGGSAAVTIPAGARVLSDAVRLITRARTDLAISMHLPQDLSAQTSPASYHVRALQTSYIAPGDQVQEADLASAETTTAWFYLAAVESQSGWLSAVVAGFGDSITDGDQLAAMEPVDQNERYTDFLARRLIVARDFGRYERGAVVNLGKSGNQLQSTFIGENMLARLNADVLSISGLTHLIVLGGINDLGLPVLLGAPQGASVEALIAAHLQIVRQARAQGVIVIGGTLPPSGGSFLPGYNTPETDAARQALNDWIRHGGAYDAVADFDRHLRDPENPGAMRADLTADGLHPNSEGYRRMAAVAEAALRRSATP